MEKINLLLLAISIIAALVFSIRINQRIIEIEQKIDVSVIISYVRAKMAYANSGKIGYEQYVIHPETYVEFYFRSLYGFRYIERMMKEKEQVIILIRKNYPEISAEKAQNLISPFYPKIKTEYSLDDVAEIIMIANNQYCSHPKNSGEPMYTSYEEMPDYEKERTKECILEYINKNLRPDYMMELWLKDCFMTAFGKNDVKFANSVHGTEANIQNKERFDMFANVIDYLKPYIKY